MPLEVRPNEKNLPVSGIGGRVDFQWPSGTGPDKGWNPLRVRRWEIQHFYRTEEGGISGGHGSIQGFRIADHFRFICIVDLDAKPVVDDPAALGPGPSSQPHFDGRMEGSSADDFTIGIRFFMGDPTFWRFPNVQTIARPPQTFHPLGDLSAGAYYHCPRIQLEEVYILNQVNQPRVVQCVIKGKGSAPLRRYVLGAWCGGGALGIAEAIQKAGDV